MKIFLYFKILLFVLCIPYSIKAETNYFENLYQWNMLPPLPYSAYGTFAGTSNSVLIAAGGCSRWAANPTEKLDSDTHWLDTIAVLEPESKEWIIASKLPYAIAYGAAVQYQNSLILVGGRDKKTCFNTVYQITWDPAQRIVKIISLPDLPRPCAYAGCACIDDTIYLAGGIDSIDVPTPRNFFWSLTLAKIDSGSSWQNLPSCSDLSDCIQPVVQAQSNGENTCLYVWGENHSSKNESNGQRSYGFRYEPFQKSPADQWVKLENPPLTISGANTYAAGQSHIMVFAPHAPQDFVSDLSKPSSIYAYHTITNTWIEAGPTPPAGIGEQGTVWNDQTILFVPSLSNDHTQIVSGICTDPQESFGTVNYISLIVYLFGTVLIGYYFSKRENTTEDYFLAGKRIPWWAAGISIFATSFSAITMLGTPAKAYATNWLYFFTAVALLPIMPFVAYAFLPFLRKLNVTTAYEYLEKRFNLFVRLFGSIVFILFQIARMSIVLLLPAIALATATGINIHVCIITMGVLCIIYTVLGGIEAVIWTDVLQLAVLMGAIILAIIIIIMDIDGGVSAIIHTGQTDNKFQLVNLTWDFTVPALWVVLIGNMLSNLAPYITDQSVVQRYLTTPDIKQARSSLWFNFWFTIPCEVLIFILGTSLYVYFKSNPSLLHPAIKTDAIFPWFAIQKMPPGLCGLVIAGIFAASMSSLDSAMHSVATAIINDFYKLAYPRSSEKHRLTLSRRLVCILGVFGTGSALYLAGRDILSLWDFFMTLLGLLGGGMSGVFLLGIFTRRTHGTGAFLGAIASAIMVFVVQTYTNIHFFLYGAIGVIVSMVVGYVISLILPSHKNDLSGLTLYTLNEKVKSEVSRA